MLNIQMPLHNANPNLALLSLLSQQNLYIQPTQPVAMNQQLPLSLIAQAQNFQLSHEPLYTVQKLIPISPFFQVSQPTINTMNQIIQAENRGVTKAFEADGNLKTEHQSNKFSKEFPLGQEKIKSEAVEQAKIEYEPTLQMIQVQKYSDLPTLSPTTINKMTAELDLSLKEDEPGLAIFTRNFPEWSLGEILDLFLLYSQEEIEETKKSIIQENEQKIEEKLRKQKEEEEEEKDPLKPNIRTRNWKNNHYNRKHEDGSSITVRKKNPPRSYILKLKQLLGLPAINDRKAQALLSNNSFNIDRAIKAVKENLEYFKKYLAL